MPSRKNPRKRNLKKSNGTSTLLAVNQALKDEVRTRHALEAQLAIASQNHQADHHAAFHDLLTGLPNRALFNDRLDVAIAQANRRGLMLAVMFTDLDCFKVINDTYGHSAGDSVLKAMELRLMDHTRSADTVCRFGGDEFLFLLSDLRDESDIHLIARKLLKAIEAPCLIATAGAPVSLQVKASLGFSVFRGVDDTGAALIKRADDAMYEVKRQRRSVA